jgi:hypothetical protein
MLAGPPLRLLERRKAAMKALLAGTAMLLATVWAHADWQCGEVKVEVKKLTSERSR